MKANGETGTIMDMGGSSLGKTMLWTTTWANGATAAAMV